VQPIGRLFHHKFGISLSNKLVKILHLEHSFAGAETWIFRKVDQRHLESFAMWCWRRMEKISWPDRVRNEEVLRRVREEGSILRTARGGRLIG